MRIGRNQAELIRWIQDRIDDREVREPFRIPGYTHSQTRAMWNALVRSGAIRVWNGVVEGIEPRAQVAAFNSTPAS